MIHDEGGGLFSTIFESTLMAPITQVIPGPLLYTICSGPGGTEGMTYVRVCCC